MNKEVTGINNKLFATCHGHNSKWEVWVSWVVSGIIYCFLSSMDDITINKERIYVKKNIIKLTNWPSSIKFHENSNKYDIKISEIQVCTLHTGNFQTVLIWMSFLHQESVQCDRGHYITRGSNNSNTGWKENRTQSHGFQSGRMEVNIQTHLSFFKYSSLVGIQRTSDKFILSVRGSTCPISNWQTDSISVAFYCIFFVEAFHLSL